MCRFPRWQYCCRRYFPGTGEGAVCTRGWSWPTRSSFYHLAESSATKKETKPAGVPRKPSVGNGITINGCWFVDDEWNPTNKDEKYPMLLLCICM
jgi:hypothetical protein